MPRSAQFGGGARVSQPMKFVLGLDAQAGALFGDPGPFFVSQAFSLGGVQYGEQLRGYEEFSITPHGYIPRRAQYQRRTRASFGNAFFTSTAELGLRLNQSLYLDAFYDAGNVWERPREFDPTRLFRGVGVGGSHRHSARTARRRSWLRLRPRGRARAGATPSGKFTSNSDRSSNRSFFMRSFLRAATRRARLCSQSSPASAGAQARLRRKIALRQHADAAGQRPGTRRGGSQFKQGDATATGDQLQKMSDSLNTHARDVPEGRADAAATAQKETRRKTMRRSGDCDFRKSTQQLAAAGRRSARPS